MTEALLPQTLGGVFDEAFDLYKRHFVTLALIVAVIHLPTQMILNLLSYSLRQTLGPEGFRSGSPDVGAVLGAMFTLFFYFLIAVASLIIATGPIASAISDIYLGRPTSLRRAYRGALKHGLRLLGGWAIVSLVFIGVYFLAALVVGMVVFLLMLALGLMNGAMQNDIGGFAVLLLMLCIYILPYLISWAVIARFFIFTTQLIVLEGLSVSEIPARNALLVGKTRFWRTFAAVFFLPIVTFGLQALIQYSTLAALRLLHLPPLPQFLAQTAVGSAVGFFFQPYWMIFLTLLYYDYRVRREGLDVRLLSAGLPPPQFQPASTGYSYPGMQSASPSVGQPPPPPVSAGPPPASPAAPPAEREAP
jgi:hypothetical protein